MNRFLTPLALLVLSLVAACATPQTQAAATPEERAQCEAMSTMGSGATHDHPRDRTGSPGAGTAMAAQHERCRQILAN